MKKSDLKKLVKEAIAEIREEEAIIQRGKNVYDAIIKNNLQNLFKTMSRGTEFPSKYDPKDSDMQVKLNNKIYDQSPKLKVLVQKLEKAKKANNKELVDKIEKEIKFQKIRIDVNR